MKRILAFALALVMALSLAACGGGGEEKGPSGSIADIGGGGAQGDTQSGTQTPDGSQAVPPAGTESGVEISGNKIIHTKDDGMGTHSVFEYVYQDGALSEITVVFSYNDNATAEMMYDQMKNGDLKQTADATYQSFERKGKEIHCKMTEGYTSAFAGMSQEQMVALLEGGDPFAVGGGEVGETTINTPWSELALPDGFPKLAEGVTTYTQISENIFSMEWDAMPKADADAMAEKLEKWTGGTFELMDDPGGKNWFVDTGKYNVTLTYVADTFDGTMPQLMLNVSIWE